MKSGKAILRMEGFLAALKSEYVDDKGAKVGKFLDRMRPSSKQERALDKLESKVRKAAKRGQQEALAVSRQPALNCSTTAD